MIKLCTKSNRFTNKDMKGELFRMHYIFLYITLLLNSQISLKQNLEYPGLLFFVHLHSINLHFQ